MAGPDGSDPFSIQTEPDDFLAYIDKGVKGMRFAWTDDFGFAQRYAAPESARVIALCRAEATKMGSLGASVEETKEVWDDIMPGRMARSEEHTSELQSLMRISYAVFCLKKKMKRNNCTAELHLQIHITT